MKPLEAAAPFRNISRCCVAAGLAVCAALAEQLPTTIFSAQDGLHTTVNRILVDSRGFVWFPGSEGLARFDGNGFHMFTRADGLPTRVVSAFFERRDGTYWVAGGEHLCLFDPRSNHTRFQCESLKLGAIRTLLEDERGLWCGTQTGLWRRPASGAKSWEAVRGHEPTGAKNSSEVDKLLKDARGDVWALTHSGLFRFRSNGRVEHWSHAQGLAMDNGTALSETPGSMWAGSQTELFRFSIDPQSGVAAVADRYDRSHGLPSGYVADVRFWRGQVWAATFQGLARQLPSGRWQAVELDPNLRGFPMNILAIDALGNLWAGTDSAGAVRISGSGLSSFSESEGLGVRKVWAVFEDRQGNLIAVTKDEDHYFLNRFDGNRFQPVRLNAPLGIDFAWSWSQIVVHSRSGDWWLGTGNGLLRYPHGVEAAPSLLGKEGLPRSGNIFRVFEDSRGAIWVSIRAMSDNRLYRRDPATGRFERFGEADGLPPLHLYHNVPSALAEDRNGAIWIGMWTGGLVRYRNGRFQQFASSSGAPRQGVRTLLVDGQGRVWIGSNAEGLLRIEDPSAEHPVFSAYTRSSGLSSDTISALAEDLDGRIYLAGDGSVDRLDPRAPLGTERVRRFTAEDGLRAGDWPTYHGDISGNRHSPLDQINPANVKDLALKWVFPITHYVLEVTPVVIDGVMFVTGPNQVYALDARAGRTLWHYQRPRSAETRGDPSKGTNRGVAVLGDRVFFVTDNARLLALHRVTGQLLWEVEITGDVTDKRNYGNTSAPLVVNDLVVAGVSGGDLGMRGFLDAYKVTTGERVWRFWTVPKPGEPGSETWQGTALAQYGGGGATWMTGTFDPETNTVFWGSGNPYPPMNGDERKGDNLYSDCVLALDAATGKLKWHYQFTPHDLYDWDGGQTPMLINRRYRGRERKLLLQANRNGFFYVFDRTDGTLLLAEKFVDKLTWASGVGKDGRPIILPGLEPARDGTKVCPNVLGATNWPSMALSPSTGFFYLMAREACGIYVKTPSWNPKRIPLEPGQMFLRALDIETGKRAWEVPQIGPADSWGGVLSAGGVVFFGEDSGALGAVDAKTGKDLWHIQTNASAALGDGHSWRSSPMTFLAGGRQYVAFAAGPNILCFGLP